MLQFNDEDCSRETAPYQHDEDAPQDQDEANDDVLPGMNLFFKI